MIVTDHAPQRQGPSQGRFANHAGKGTTISGISVARLKFNGRQDRLRELQGQVLKRSTSLQSDDGLKAAARSTLATRCNSISLLNSVDEEG